MCFPWRRRLPGCWKWNPSQGFNTFSHSSLPAISPSLTLVGGAATSVKSVTREGRNGVASTSCWTSTGLISFLAAGLRNFSCNYVVTSGWSVGTWVWYRSDGGGIMLTPATSGILKNKVNDGGKLNAPERRRQKQWDTGGLNLITFDLRCPGSNLCGFPLRVQMFPSASLRLLTSRPPKRVRCWLWGEAKNTKNFQSLFPKS